MSVLIDPYMFNLSSETEIRKNLEFFRKIIHMSIIQEESIQIALYKGLIDRIHDALPGKE